MKKTFIFFIAVLLLSCTNSGSGPNRSDGKLYLRTMSFTGVYGPMLDISWLYLGGDGTIVRNPKNGVDPVNYEAEKQMNADNVGTYSIEGNTLNVKWQNGTGNQWTIEHQSGGAISAIDGGIVTQQNPLPPDYRLNGEYDGGAVLPNVAASHTFVFNKDGSFTLNKLGTVNTADVSGEAESNSTGTYSITGNTLRLNFADGQKQAAVIAVWDDGSKKNLVINETSFPQEGQ